MTNAEFEEQETFRDVTHYSGLVWKHANRLLLCNLTPPQRAATIALTQAIGRFTFALTETARRPPITPADDDAPPREAPRLGPKRKAPHPYVMTVRMLGSLWAHLHDLLFMPNRLNETQHALAVAVIDAANGFNGADFGNVIPASEDEDREVAA